MLVGLFTRQLARHRAPLPSYQQVHLQLLLQIHPISKTRGYSRSIADQSLVEKDGAKTERWWGPQIVERILEDVKKDVDLEEEREVEHIPGQGASRRKTHRSPPARVTFTKKARELLEATSPKIKHASNCSGYGWTVAVPVNRIKVKARYQVDASPFQMLKPYENPLLVILISSTFATGEEFAEKLAKGIADQVYHNIEGNVPEIQLLIVYVGRVSIPAAVTNVMPADMLSEGANGYSFFWTTQDKLMYQKNEEDASSFSSEKDRTPGLTIRLLESSPQRSDKRIGYSQFKINLANTTFTTGRTHTMHLNKYVFHRSKGDTKEASSLLHMGKESSHIDDQDVRLEIDGAQGHMKLHAYSKETRTELTPWRTVAEISGNVIKSLQGESGPMPASIELETAITKVPPSEHGRFEVWTEVESKKDVSNTSAEKTLNSSNILIKVVSGGGGWGEKRGLIALDPNSVPDRENLDTFDFDNLFPSSCEVGAQIRFLKVLTRYEDLNDITSFEALRRSTGSCIEQHGHTTFGFGTMGNPEIDTAEALDEENTRLPWRPVIYGHCGAMSQRMTYERMTPGQNKDNGIVLRTELPPYTHFSTGGEVNPSRKIANQDPNISANNVEPSTEIEFIWTAPQEDTKLQKATPTPVSIEHVVEGSQYKALEATDWAAQERLVFENLKWNAPRSDAKEVLQAQARRYKDLFKLDINTDTASPGAGAAASAAKTKKSQGRRASRK